MITAFNPPKHIGFLITAMCLLHATVSLAETPPTLLQLAFPDVPTGESGGRQVLDYSPLALSYARTWGNPNGVEVAFTVPVDPTTATNTANYTLVPGVTVLSATMGTNTYTVVLTTTGMTNGALHTLFATNVLDATLQFTLEPTTQAPVLKAQGVITRNLFSGITGSAVSNLTNAAKFPNAPDAVNRANTFEAPTNTADNYGLQFAGYVHPPTTGDYAFFVAADDQAALYLSSDDNPAGKTLIATVTGATAARSYTSTTNQRSAYVRLEAGRAYYIEALLKENTGGDHLAVAWRLRGMSAPATGDSPVPGAFLSSLTPSAPVSILAQPQPLTVAERAPTTFGVTPTGTPPYTYQWLKNGVPIPGATSNVYAIASAPASFNGLAFSVIVSNGFSSTVSSPALLTVTADTTPPTLVRIDGNATLDRVLLTFSEPVTPAKANNSANYAFTGGLTVLDARLQANGTNVVLLTSPHTPGAAYTLTATGITDTFAQHNTAPTSAGFTAWVSSRGFLRREVFTGISGTTVADLVNNTRFPDSPDQTGYLVRFEAPSNVTENYGQRVFGWLLPPATGFYRFFLSSDDSSALFLSSDADPVNATTVATMTSITASSRNWATAAQTSPIWLEAGHSYYVEAQMKEATGNDHLAVAWQLPGGLAPTNGAPPIDGAFLSACATPFNASLVVMQQPLSVTVPESSATNFAISITSSYATVFYQWQKNGADIPGANTATYTTPRLFRADDGARFRCCVSIPGTNFISVEAVLTVMPDNTPPQAMSAATLTGSDTVGLGFSELLDPATATNPASYTLSTGGQVLRATLRTDGQTVALIVATLSFTNFTVTVKGVKDLAGNAVAANAAVEVEVSNLEASDLGTPGTDPLERGSGFTSKKRDYDVVAGGSDIWNTSDGGHWLSEIREGDFDIQVKVARLDKSHDYSKAGIMVRENLKPGSRSLFVAALPPSGANKFHALWRSVENGITAHWLGSPSSDGVPPPNAWLRMSRAGNVFTAFRGTNGTAWIQFAQLTLTNFPTAVFAGLAATSHSNVLGQTTTAWFRDYFATGTVVLPTPLDLLIKDATDPVAKFSLDDVYQTIPHGAQSLWQIVTSNAPCIFQVLVQNDGSNTVSPVVKAIETAEAGWAVTYRVADQDITAQIRGTNGYAVTNLVAGAPETITVEFLPGSRVSGGTSKSATLSVFTDRYTTSLRDTVKATAFIEPSDQPDLMVRRLTDVIYRGKGVFNADGTGQTKALEFDYGMTGVYPIQLINAGNMTNFFTLRGTAGAAGWAVRYLDAVSAGSDITDDMTSVGTLVALPPAASWEGRVEVTFDATVPRGTSNTVFVTATAVGNEATSSDTVRIITSVITTSDIALAGLYTTDADFEKGTLNGLVYSDNQLQLGGESTVTPFIWVPNYNSTTIENSISKVDTRTGRELGRYRVAPTGVHGDPSRTTVDQYGNCWVVNRYSGTVVKVGLSENGQYLDRNHNGVADTSRDLNGDGDITGGELMPWGQDECVLYEVVLIAGKEGTFTPGTYTGGYTNDWGTPGVRGLAVDAQRNVWVGTYERRLFFYLDGSSAQILRSVDVSSANHTSYGMLIDTNGVVWSAGNDKDHILRLNPANDSFIAIPLGHTVYGIGADRFGHVFASGYDDSKLSRINALTGTKDWTVSGYYQSRGVACTDDGDVWVANSGAGTVTRWSNNGVVKANITVGTTPSGVAVDAAGKVWMVELGGEYIYRIDPATDAVDLTKRIMGGGVHYGYSDMTGIIARNVTTHFGTWSIRHNSKVEFTPWSLLTWHGENLIVTNIAGSVTNVFKNCTVRVRSSNDQQQWSSWEQAENGYPLATTPAGQYLEIEVTLQQLSPEATPAFYDIAVYPVPPGLADLEVSQSWSEAYAFWPITNRITVINHGADDASGLVLTSPLPTGLTLLSASTSQGGLVQSNGLLRWNLGSLANGASLQAESVVMATNTGTYTFSAGVKGYEIDPQTNNNRSSVALAVPQAPGVTPPPGLIAWWRGEGNAVDSVGTNNGVLVNGTGFALGKAGFAFNFDGINDVVSTPTTPFRNVRNSFTIEFWAFPKAKRTVTSESISGASGTSGQRYAVFPTLCGSDGSAGVGVSVGTNGVSVFEHASSYLPSLLVYNCFIQSWTHIAVIYQNKKATLYLNGALARVGLTSPKSFVFPGSSLADTSYGPYGGLLDEVSIFNRDLSAAEIQAIYQAGSGGKRPLYVPLTIAPAPLSGMLQLSWPSTAAGWYVQYVDALAPGMIWKPETTPPQLIDSLYQLTLPTIHTQRFYRLIAP